MSPASGSSLSSAEQTTGLCKAAQPTPGPIRETNRYKSLSDAVDPEDAYSCTMMGEEAGCLLCSLAGMIKDLSI